MSVKILDKESVSASPIATRDRPSIDIFSIHEQRAGRLVLDPAEAREEFGNEVASKLKLTKDGRYVLWPQPSNNPEDPQNWNDRRKGFQLFIIVLAAIVPDFDSGIGVASVFALAKQYETSSAEIINLTSNWSIFLSGWGGIFFVMVMRRYGRLATLFWTQLLALLFMVGATFAPTLKIFAAMRCLTAFFGTCPQVTGLYTITDLYPFHLQARMINIWTMGVVVSPHLSPFVFGFLVARTTWRWAYGIGTLYNLVVFILIVLFMKESLYFRGEGQVVSCKQTGLWNHIKSLIGITGFQSARKEPTWKEVCVAPLRVVWRPQLFFLLVFEAAVFGFGIGINVTNTVFLQSPPPFGFGFGPIIVSGIYATPVVAVILGELLGRYLNDWVMNQEIRRKNGVFEAEARLWTCYIGVLLYVIGFVVLGASLQNHQIAAFIIGWGIAQIGILVTTVAVYAYCSDCFPRHQGEISGLINLMRTLGGFGVAFFQVPWAEKHGALQTLGLEAAIVAGLFLFIIPSLQWKGRYLRAQFSIYVC